MSEPEIICCGPRIWVKTIAWIQIIFNGTSSLVMSIVLMELLSIDGSNWSTSEYREYFDSFYAAVTRCLVSLLYVLVGTGFGIILLKGVDQSRAIYLKVWVGYLAFSMTSLFLAILKEPRKSGYEAKFFVVSLIPCGFAIYVVSLLMRRIENSQQTATAMAATGVVGIGVGQVVVTREGQSPGGQTNIQFQDIPPSYDSLFHKV